MSTDGNTFVTAGTFDASLDTHTLTTGSDGLISGQIYYFRVKAVNEKGSSLWSFITQVVCEALPNPPAAIRKIDSLSTLNSMYIEWD